MCRVPQELVDVILDYVDDDIHALGNCGLVCHNWLPSARSHIFYEVELSYSRPSRVTSAVEILERSPEIALAVRSIRITADSQTESSLGEVSKILCSFTRLDELHLSCIAPHEETDSDLTTFVKSLAAVTPTVKVISMYAVSFNTFGCFSHFLRAFPLLSHLDLHTVSFPGNSAASPAFDSLEGHIPRIKIIHLSLCDAAAQMVEMLLDRDRIHLEASGSVALFCHIEPEVFPYLKLIENLGARIYNLELSLGTSIEGVSAAEMCHAVCHSLSRCTSLKTFSLEVGHGVLDKIAPIFAALPMPGTITSIQLECILFHPDLFDWNEIDTALADRSTFCNLKSVVIKSLHEEGWERGKSYLKSVNKLGILQYEATL